MSILEEILAAKRTEVAARNGDGTFARAREALATAPPVRGFGEALRRPPGAPVRVIAEIKRASPSAGPIRPNADPARIAESYTAAGASAISVLTDGEFFDGDLAFLGRARAVSPLPLLRKDFIIDAAQIAEARAAGADAVLIIVAAMGDDLLAQLIAEAHAVGMDALVEAHSAGEAARAVAAGARIFGINHRDLATFSIDRTLTARVRPSLPEDAVVIAESGIRSAADIAAVKETGADAVLVGESLMRADSPGAALAALLSPVQEAPAP